MLIFLKVFRTFPVQAYECFSSAHLGLESLQLSNQKLKTAKKHFDFHIISRQSELISHLNQQKYFLQVL